MVTGFLVILAMFLVLAGTGPLMVLWFHRFVSDRYPIPGLGELVLQMVMRSTEDESSVDVVMKRIRHQIPGFSIRSIDPGIQHIYRVHVLLLAPQDCDLIAATIGLRELCQDYANAYAAFALKRGWKGNLGDPLEIYVVPDLASTPNHPRIRGAKPTSNHQPYFVVPLLPDSFSSAAAREPDPEQAAARVTAGPAVTLPYGPMQKPTPVGEGKTRHMRPEELAEFRDAGADGQVRGGAAGPGLFVDGRLVTDLEGEIRVGRGNDCQVFVKDATVSRSHASLRESHGVWVLVPDEGKPCYVNGEFVAQVTPLVDGDVLSFAGSAERFEFRG